MTARRMTAGRLMSSGAAPVTIPTEQISRYLRKQSQTPSFRIDPDDRVMTLEEWRNLRRVSASTERRMRDKGIGPRLTRLSATRWGVTVRDDKAWLASGGAVQAAE
jgi:hypothetical protein